MRIGIDLGGTKIEAIALGTGGAELHRHRIPTPRDDYDATVRAVRDLVLRLESGAGAPATVGIGMPGIISPASGLVKNANSTWLNGRPFDRDVATALGRPVRVENDANCFALSEAVDRAGAGEPVVFGVIAGTGTGGGVVVHGRVITGHNAIAGEWGHNPLPWAGAEDLPAPPCYCGRSGCIETYLSGPGLAADHARHTGQPLDAASIAARAAQGDETCRTSLARHARRFARALASIVNVLDPDVIVLGGGVSHLQHLYTAIPEQWTPFIFSDRVTTRVTAPKHGDSSGVRGAAWLWPEADAV
jgi:fructokinase